MAIPRNGEEDIGCIETLNNALSQGLVQYGMETGTRELHYSGSTCLLLIKALAWHHALLSFSTLHRFACFFSLGWDLISFRTGLRVWFSWCIIELESRRIIYFSLRFISM